jgi:opacity protein-like surface antigen
MFAGGNKNVVPQDTPVAVVPSMETKVPSNFYIGLGIGLAQINSELYEEDSIVDATLKVGYNLHKYLAVEARGSMGLSDGDKLGHDYSYGLYLKPKYPIYETFSVYGLLGYAKSKISFENEVAFNGITNDYTEQDGFSFGAGAEYSLNNHWSLSLEAVRYIDESNTKPEGTYAIKVDTANIGVNYYF